MILEFKNEEIEDLVHHKYTGDYKNTGAMPS